MTWASLAVVGIAAGVAGAEGPKTMRVSGRAELTPSICRGGVAVTREDYEALPPPSPIAGRAFLVVAGAHIRAGRPVARFTTRADGTFTTRLPAGTWCLFDASRALAEERAAPAAAPRAGIDADCLAEERRRCDLVLPVKADVRGARIVFPERCPQPWAQPCYHGPMPP
jgi:hypothetical protein